MANDYTAPVNQLLTIGEVALAKSQRWPNYPEKYGLTEADIPELIRMATDTELNYAPQDSQKVWAPLHAWRSLGQLRAAEAVKPLLTLLDEDDDDYAREELPSVFGLIGSPAVEPVAEFLRDRNHTMYGRAAAAAALAQIGQQDEAAYHRCVSALSEQLKHYVRQDNGFNSFLVAELVNLGAVEAAPVIEAAFRANRVDPMVMGDWEDVQAALGLIPYSELQQRRYEAARRPLVDFSTAASGKQSSSSGGFGSSSSGKKSKKKRKKK
jgi:hypothetical protein